MEVMSHSHGGQVEMLLANALEFYETPLTFTEYLLTELRIFGTVLEPTVGNGAIIRAFPDGPESERGVQRWVTNDLDERWPADYHMDAAKRPFWQRLVDDGKRPTFTIGNPPFSPAIPIIAHALEYSVVGVAMHLRVSIHEVLKTGIRRTWMAENPPTGILFLPRFAYQRSRKTGKWATDSVCACWVVWLKDTVPQQFIRHAPAWVVDALEAETPGYRKTMDALMASFV